MCVHTIYWLARNSLAEGGAVNKEDHRKWNHIWTDSFCMFLEVQARVSLTEHSIALTVGLHFKLVRKIILPSDVCHQIAQYTLAVHLPQCHISTSVPAVEVITTTLSTIPSCDTEYLTG